MNYKLKYYCDFRSVSETLYRIEIYENTTTSITAQEVTMIRNSALLEFEPIGHLDKMVYPSFSFTLMSQSNFQFHSLYSSDLKKHKVVLKRSGMIVYTGWVDSEVYEEDYSKLNKYNVDISTSSLAVLKRVDNALFGMMRIKDIISTILANIDITNISYHINKTASTDAVDDISIEDIDINTDVFLNEDIYDKKCYYDILNSILTAFNCTLFLYDNKAIITDHPQTFGNQIDIDQNVCGKATLGVCDSYKEISIIFDPNTASEITTSELEYDDFATIQPYSTVHYAMPKDANYRSFSLQQFEKKEFDKIKVLTHNQLTVDGISYKASRIIPSFSGSKDAFVCHSWGASGEADRTNKSVCWYDNTRIGNKPIMETSLIPISNTTADKWFINLKLNMLISATWNAIEAAERANDEGNDSDFQNWSNFIYIPGDLELCDADGKVLYYYDNSKVVTDRGWNQTYVGWVPVTRFDNTYPNGKYFFSYYDNRKNTTPFKNSFANNSLSCGYTGKDESIPFRHEKMKGQGDIIPLPPVPGYLRIRVRSGIEAYDSGMVRMSALLFKIKHMWYKSITVGITDENGLTNKSDNEYVYRGEIDNYAENSEEINTILGIVPILDMSGRGSLYFNTEKIKEVKLKDTILTGMMLEETVLSELAEIFESKRSIINATTKRLNFMQRYVSSYLPGKTFVLAGAIIDIEAERQESTLIEYP